MSEESGEDEPPSPSFEERLKAARSRQGLDAPPPLTGRDTGDMGGMSPWGIGLRVGIELVSALVVAVAIGWDWATCSAASPSSLRCSCCWAARPGY